MAKYTEKKKISNRNWDKDNLDRISIALPKGRKAEIQEAAKARGMSVNGWINSLIDTAIDQEGDGFHIQPAEKNTPE